MKDIAIPIVFPEYNVLIEEINSRMPLGHAGILFINGASGVTKYFEYGRYDPQRKGLTRKQSIPDVTLVREKPTKVSLTATLRRICNVAGGGTRIMAAYIELDPGSYQKMLEFCNKRIKDNANPNRTPYSIVSFSCNTFVHDVATAGGANMPPIEFNPTSVLGALESSMVVPRVFMGAVRVFHTSLDYTPQPETLTGAGY